MQWNFAKHRIFTGYTIKRGHLINGIGYFLIVPLKEYILFKYLHENHVIVTEPFLFLTMWRQTMDDDQGIARRALDIFGKNQFSFRAIKVTLRHCTNYDLRIHNSLTNMNYEVRCIDYWIGVDNRVLNELKIAIAVH